jgi:hypothetical protein
VVAGAVGAAVWALTAGGGASRATGGFDDGGLLVAWGLPLVRLAADLATIATLGALIGGLLFSPRGAAGVLSPVGRRYGRLAAVAALTWTLASATQLVFVAADLSGRPVDGLSR